VAPAIHLGAERICVIGAGLMHEPRTQPALVAEAQYPTLAQIAGHALSNIFLDALAVDVERIRRINQTLSLVPPELRSASNLDVKERRHCERSDAIHDFQKHGSPRYARDDGTLS
jgi:NTE family protein